MRLPVHLPICPSVNPPFRQVAQSLARPAVRSSFPPCCLSAQVCSSTVLRVQMSACLPAFPSVPSAPTSACISPPAQPPIHPCIHLSARPSVCLPVRPSVRSSPPVHAFVSRSSTCLLVFPSISPPARPRVRPPISLLAYLSARSLARVTVSPPVRPDVRAPFCPPVCSINRPRTRAFVHPISSACLPTRPRHRQGL